MQQQQCLPRTDWYILFHCQLWQKISTLSVVHSSTLQKQVILITYGTNLQEKFINSGHNLLALNKVHFRNTIRLHKLSSLEDSPRKSVFYQIPFYDYVIVSFHQICKLNCHKASECCSTNIKEQLMSHKSVWRLNRFKTFKKFWATNLKKFIKRQWQVDFPVSQH